MAVRTPCIGICSTTYGDLVCRGCKRFAHEVVGWNQYDTEQRSTVWHRLDELRDASVSEFLRVTDEPALREAAASLRIPFATERSALSITYEVLRRLPRSPNLDQLGLTRSDFAAQLEPERLFVAIDREFYTRASAAYERSFRTLAQ